MAVPVNRKISKEKEVFLAICLLAGEISAEVVRQMKKDFGEVKVKNGIIQTLTADGYIKKINRRTGYGYQLTPKGVEYFKSKCPNKYDYDNYSDSSAFKYNEGVRYRNLTMSSILYYLWKSGVTLTNNMETAYKILNFKEVSVETPFFISTKQMKKLHVRFQAVYGYRIYGWIYTRRAVWGVYFPDAHHPIYMGREKAVYTSMNTVFQYSKPPYCTPQNNRFLFLYKNENDYINSFNGYDGFDTPSKFTAYFYLEYHYKTICTCLMTESNNLAYMLDDGYYYRINDVFEGSFELKKAQINSHFFRYRYTCEEDRTAIVWDLNPTVITETIDLCHNNNYYDDYFLLLCFDESVDLLERLLKKHHVDRQVEIDHLPRQEVLDYIENTMNYKLGSS